MNSFYEGYMFQNTKESLNIYSFFGLAQLCYMTTEPGGDTTVRNNLVDIFNE